MIFLLTTEESLSDIYGSLHLKSEKILILGPHKRQGEILYTQFLGVTISSLKS